MNISSDYIDLPLNVTIDDYHAVDRHAIAFLQKFDPEKHLTLFRQGGCSAPGISDIDYILVFADGDEIGRQLAWRLKTPDAWFFEKLHRKLFVHQLEVMNESLFHKLRYRCLFANPVKLYGNSKVTLNTSEEEDKIGGLINCIEALPLKTSELLRLLHKPYRVRRIAITLNAICHNLNFLKIFDNIDMEVNSINDYVLVFRKQLCGRSPEARW